ncbi:MAG: hypothetical protein JXR26_11245, partial [Balneolaceae bacterium]|nr:hypothetical protein [Balneolaceae bacterium]
KELGDYYKQLDEDKRPVAKVLQLCKDDQIRKHAIMRLMCEMGLSFAEIEEKWGIVFDLYFSDSLRRLEKIEADGLVKINQNEIRITEQGRLFLRNIAMCFDRYLHEAKTGRSFSKTV